MTGSPAAALAARSIRSRSPSPIQSVVADAEPDARAAVAERDVAGEDRGPAVGRERVGGGAHGLLDARLAEDLLERRRERDGHGRREREDEREPGPGRLEHAEPGERARPAHTPRQPGQLRLAVPPASRLHHVVAGASRRGGTRPSR